MTHILAIDQGTTSSRSIVFDGALKPVASVQQEFPQHFPNSGWVEHDAEDIWTSVVETARDAIQSVGVEAISAIGITNQRETTLIWDRETGEPIHRAIVWQDRRTAALCNKLKAEGHEPLVTQHTGLLLDPYFSATKVKWLLDNVEGAREKANAGKLAFGTMDCFLIWRMTGGKSHATDATNAARTMLYDIRNGCWDSDICTLLDIPMSLLPNVKDSADEFGETLPDLFGHPLPILGVAGDQQAATVGQACFEPGMMKSTYGTGCFALLNTGDKMITSKNRLLTTIAYQLDGKPTYALEGSIFVAGAAVQWLRDGMKIVDDAAQTGAMARDADPKQAVYLVPAFTGLGAPYWDAECRGAIYGLTRNTGPNELARAALQAVGYQTADLLDAMRADWPGLSDETTLRVDGGMTASNYTMQFLADITGAVVDRPKVLETTAVGAAWLAGHKAGVYPNQSTLAQTWAHDQQFNSQIEEKQREAQLKGWKNAVRRTLT